MVECYSLLSIFRYGTLSSPLGYFSFLDSIPVPVNTLPNQSILIATNIEIIALLKDIVSTVISEHSL